MGDCVFCGEPAGFLRKQHPACAERRDRAAESIEGMCADAALRGSDLDGLADRMRDAWKVTGLDMSDNDLRNHLASGWTRALELAINDHILSNEERHALNRYRRHFRLTAGQLDQQGEGGHFEKFRMMALLNTVTEGEVIPRFDRAATRARHGRLPFNFMKSEALLWLFEDTGYAEQVTSREFQGSSMGASFRVAKGVYVRPGTFRGRTVETKEMVHTDTGTMGITTKHIYFTGSEKSFRIRLERIVSFQPYGNALGIMRDTARAKPEAFIMSATSSWFAVNVIDALLDRDDVPLPKKDSPTLDDIVDDAGDDGEAGMFAAGMSLSL